MCVHNFYSNVQLIQMTDQSLRLNEHEGTPAQKISAHIPLEANIFKKPREYSPMTLNISTEEEDEIKMNTEMVLAKKEAFNCLMIVVYKKFSGTS